MQPGNHESERAPAIRAHMQRILSDPIFSGANRRSRLLRYLVEETLADRGSELKESVIAAEVFDRSPDYDPQIDSVVRVEVARLRARLAEYYEKAGAGEVIRIEIPKGGYRPVFAFRENPPPAPQPHRRPRWTFALAGAAAALAIIAIIVWRARVSPPQSLGTIAVLPFLNLSGNPADEYLSDGISDELTEVLAEFNDLRVVARTSAFQYKGKGADVREIGRNLMVGAILEGSVARSENQVRVIAQLIRTGDGYHLWSHTYDAPLAELQHIETGIARATREKLDPSAPAAAAQPSASRDPEAHDLYIRAVYEFNRRTLDSTRQAIDLARRAAQKDASFAQPYVVMAAGESQLNTMVAQPADLSAKNALADIDQALALDPQNSAAHAMKALLVYTEQWDWPQAEREFQLALSSGSHGSAENLYGWCLMTRGRFEEARRHLDAAAELDPLSLGPQLNMVEDLMDEQKYAEARRKSDEILRAAPASPVAQMVALSLAYWQRDCDSATALDRKLQAFYSNAKKFALSTVAADAACGRSGDMPRLSAAVKARPSDYPSPYLLAGTFALGGDADHALASLQKSAQLHEPSLMQLKVDRAFEFLRQDPRFIALERKIGLIE